MNKADTATAAFILIELAGTTYAIASESVQQIEMVETVTKVPHAPHFVEGVVFCRGQVVPAINLRQRFGFDKTPHDDRTRLVVVAQNDRQVGFIVDAAREFVKIAADSMQLPPEGLSQLSGKYLRSIARVGDRLVLILNIDEVLNFADVSSPLTPSAAT